MQRKTVLFCDSDRTRHLVRNLYSHLDPHVLVVCFKRCSVRQRQRPRRHTRSTEGLYGGVAWSPHSANIMDFTEHDNIPFFLVWCTPLRQSTRQRY